MNKQAVRNRRRDALVAGTLGHAMRAGHNLGEALDFFARAFVQLYKCRGAGDFQYVTNCMVRAEWKADDALREVELARAQK